MTKGETIKVGDWELQFYPENPFFPLKIMHKCNSEYTTNLNSECEYCGASTPKQLLLQAKILRRTMLPGWRIVYPPIGN